jgi:hypothetical protein
MCDCVKKVNTALAEKNGRLSMTYIVSDDNSLSRVMVVKTERTDGKRAAAPLVVASYCPFCGEKANDTQD